MRWLVLGACLGLAAGCGRLGSSKSLGQTEGFDAAFVRRDASASDRPPPAVTRDGGADVLPRQATGGAGGSAVGPRPNGDPPSDGGAATCPPAIPAGADVSAPSSSWSYTTAVPFSCDPMPSSFFFPRPGDDVAGAYARCASFGDPSPRDLAISADGTRVALLGSDGIARIVDVATHTVIGVLAPPRSSVDRAAFSPSGDTIVTVDRGQLLVTLWRADTFTPVWNTTLPGQTYDLTFNGAASFSPDGNTLLVSPGSRVYLLDVGTGAIRATYDQGTAVQSVSGASYGWNGRRIVVVTSPISGMCSLGPVGGSAVILDANTLSPIATPVTWQALGDEGPPPAPVFAAASADLMLTYGQTEEDAGIAMFRMSDGVRLPSPAITGFPLLVTPDGTAALFAISGTLQLERIADASVIASTVADAPHVVAMSGDGTTIAAGGSGADLLGIWRPASTPIVPTCSANPDDTGGVTLSADGQTVALGHDGEFRVLRRGDGTVILAIDQPNAHVDSLSLSPHGSYALARFEQNGTPFTETQALYRISDGTKLADVDTNCHPAVFSPDETTLQMSCSRSGTPGYASTSILELSTGRLDPGLQFTSGYSVLVGLSAGCPLVADGLQTGVWRACGTCSGPTFAAGTEPGVLSADGTTYLAADDKELTGSDLWQVLPAPRMLGNYPPRPEGSTWMVSELPVAIDTHGQRVMTRAEEQAPCSSAPGFTSRIHDVASGATLDDLPPWVTSTSADLSVIVYGSVLWCAR